MRPRQPHDVSRDSHVPVSLTYKNFIIGAVVVAWYHYLSAYHHLRCEFDPRSWRGVLDTTLCDKVCQ
jgi:hypothetical protein